MTNVAEHLLISFNNLLYVFFEEMPIQFLSPFIVGLSFFISSSESYLYVLKINSLPEIKFANIFSHSIGCPFTFLMLSLEA
jgi:hypothetical protein